MSNIGKVRAEPVSSNLVERNISPERRDRMPYVHLGLIIAVIFVYLLLGPVPTGRLIDVDDSGMERLDLNVTNSSAYTVVLNELPENSTITGLSLSGTAFGTGTFRVYLGHGEERYLIAEKEEGDDGLFQITGLAGFGIPTKVVFNETGNLSDDADEELDDTTENISEEESVEEPLNDTVEMNEIEEEDYLLNESLNKTDEVDEYLNESSVMNESVEGNESLLYNETADEDILFNESVENVTEEDLDEIPEPEDVVDVVNETAFSNETNRTTEIYVFENECVETCSLMLQDNAFLLFVIVDDVWLELDSVTYTYSDSESLHNATDIINNPPFLVKFIPDIVLSENKTVDLNLSEYFEDESELTYSYEEALGVDFDIDGEILSVSVNENFEGEAVSFVEANDGIYPTLSNTFSITFFEYDGTGNESNRTDELVQYGAEIGKPVKWVRKVKSTSDDVGKSLSVEIPVKSKKVKVKKDGKEPSGFGAKSKSSYEDGWVELDYIVEKEDVLYEVEYETPGPELIEEKMSDTKKKIVVASEFHYMNILTYVDVDESPASAIKVYRTTEGKEDISRNESYNLTLLDESGDGLIDKVQWITPHLSNESFEIEISVLNIDTYVEQGDNWTVLFTVSGEADLRISAVSDSSELPYPRNETDYDTRWTIDDELSESYDLRFLEIKCGDEVVESVWNDTDESVSVEGYSCNETSYEISRKWAPASETIALKFEFGGQVAYAYDAVTCGVAIVTSETLTGNLSCDGTAVIIGADDIVLDCDGYAINYSITGEYGYGVNNTDGYDNVTIQNCEIFEGNASVFYEHAIYVYYADNFSILNNNITVIGDFSRGLSIDSYCPNLDIINNHLTSYANNADGFYIDSSVHFMEIINNSIVMLNDGNAIDVTGSDYASIHNNTIITTGSDVVTIYFSGMEYSNITDNTINSSGADSTAIMILRNSVNSTIESNNIIYSGGNGIVINAVGTNYPSDNFIINNTLSNVAGHELFIWDPWINGTWLIDQLIGDYNITGSSAADNGSLIYFRDTGEGDVIYLEGIYGIGSNLSYDVRIESNLIDVNSSQEGLNKSANLTFYDVSVQGGATAYRNGALCGAGYCSDVTSVGNDHTFNVSEFTNYSIGGLCGTNITSSTTLTSNISCNGTAIYIGANDTVLDCAGYSINYSIDGVLGYGVNTTGSPEPNKIGNVTIQNCIIYEGNATTEDKYGIYSTWTDDFTVLNNTVATIGEDSVGIMLDVYSRTSDVIGNSVNTTLNDAHGLQIKEYSPRSEIINNTFITLGNRSNPISISTSDHGYCYNNTLKSVGDNYYALRLDVANNNTLISNTLNASGVPISAIYINRGSNNNTIERNDVVYSGGDAITINMASNNYCTDNTIKNNTLSNVAGYDLLLRDPWLNGTYLIDQPIGSYNITGSSAADNGSIVYFKDTGEGEVKYLEGIYGSGSNLSYDVRIESNLIDVNSSQTGLDKSANLTFYGMSFPGTARAFRNGTVCPDSICGPVTNVSTTYYYNVTGFSNYSLGNGTNLSIQVKTLKDVYEFDEWVNITDPPGGNEDSGIEIIDAYVDPDDVRPGDKMLHGAEVVSNNGVESVTAEIMHEKGFDVMDLELVSGNNYHGVWEGVWRVHDTLEKEYYTDIHVHDSEGNHRESRITWTDSYWSYDEDPDGSDADAGWSNPENTTDGDWNTAGHKEGASFGIVNIDIYYNKPNYATNESVWQVKDSSDTVNLTIPQGCWDYNSSSLGLRLQSQISPSMPMCLEENTLIDMPTGQKKIKDIKAGDVVYSFNGTDVVESSVQYVFNADLSGYNSTYYYIYSSGKVVLKTTWNHPVFADGEYILVKDLQPGQALMDSEMSDVIIEKIETEYAEGKTWDLSIANYDNFFANGILVHNNDPWGRWFCQIGSSAYTQLRFVNNYDIYEEAMWWYIDEPAVIFSEFSSHPLTTDFSSVGESDEELSGVVLAANDGDGKIEFDENITINNTYDLDTAIDIESNYIWLNSTLYENLNVSANLTVNTTAYADIILYKDGVVCGDCVLLSNNNEGVFKFSVTSFSNYTWEEGNQSKIVNNGTMDEEVYVFMKVQWFNTSNSVWTDDGLVYNGSSAETINASDLLKLDAFFNGKWNGSTNASYGAGTYRVYAAALDADGAVIINSDGSSVNATYNFTLDNKPSVSSPILNTSSGNNFTNEDLDCYFTVTDVDDDTLYANYTWYRNGAVNLSGQTAVTTNTEASITLGSGNTSAGDNWTCEVVPYDSYLYGTAVNSSNLSIVGACGHNVTSSLTLGSNFNCNGTALYVGSNNIVIDCNGYDLNYSNNGSLGYGINNSQGYDNITIRYCNINEALAGQNSKHAILITNSDSGVIQDNNITTLDTTSHGIAFTSSTGYTVEDNTILLNSNADGIYMYSDSDSNKIRENDITAGRDCIRFDPDGSNYPNSNNLSNNTLTCTDDDIQWDQGSDYNYLIDQDVGEYELGGVGSFTYFKDSGEADIRFLDRINGSGTNLSSDVKIETNLVELNSSQTGLNKSANLTFYGLSAFSGTPRPHRNGVECPESICANFSNSGDDYSFNVTGFTNYSVEDVCFMNLTESKTLTYDLTCPATAVQIEADSVTFDCDDYTINYSTAGIQGQGIYAEDLNKITIQNCNIVEGNTTTNTKYGVSLDNISGGVLKYSNITTSGQFSTAVRLVSVSSSTSVNDNIVIVTGTSTSGIIVAGNNTRVYDNNITVVNVGSTSGISLTNSDYGNISGNRINASYYGIRISQASGGNLDRFNNILGNTILHSGEMGISLYGNVDDTLIADNNITNTGKDAINLIATSVLGTWYRPEYNNISGNIFSDISGLELNLTDDCNYTYLIDQPISDYAFNGAGSIVYFKDTGEGEIRYTDSVIETGTNLSSDVVISSNYIYVNSSMEGLNESATLWFYDLALTGAPIAYRDGEVCPDSICGAITTSDNDYYFDVTQFSNYTLVSNNKPVVENVSLSSTGTNITGDNLTLDFDSYDDDGHNVTNITDWRVNGTSIAVLNMPFETEMNTPDTYAVEDYSIYENNATLRDGGLATTEPTWSSSGKIGGCYVWSGNDRMGIADTSSINTKDVINRTFSIWFKTDATSNRDVIYKEGDTTSGFNIYLYNDYLYTGFWSTTITDTWMNTSFSDTSDWHHVVLAFGGDDGEQKMYLDGTEVDNASETGNLSSHSGDINIGYSDSSMDFHDGEQSLGNWYDGKIDEVLIIERYLSPEQINQIYTAGTENHSLKYIVSNETTNGENWSVAVTPNDAREDGLTVISDGLFIGSTAPTIESANVTPLDPDTNSTLTCNNGTVSDIDGDTVTLYYNWSLNGSWQDVNSQTLDETYTKKGHNWSCSITPCDASVCGTPAYSDNVTINNSLPAVPDLVAPSNGNTTLFWRNVTFDWNASYDPDEAEGIDNVTYELNITPQSCGQDHYITDINSSGYSMTSDLEVVCLYFWEVRAYDGTGYSAWSDIWNLTIEPTIGITFESSQNTTDFGSQSPRETNDTTDNNPSPFTIENSGNININVSLYALDGLWDSVGINTTYFQYRADNSSEDDSFTWAHNSTQDTWRNFSGYTSDSRTWVFGNLSYSEASDTAEIELRIEVPSMESATAKSSIITVVGET